MRLTQSEIVAEIKKAEKHINDTQYEAAQKIAKNLLTIAPDILEVQQLSVIVDRNLCNYESAAQTLEYIIKKWPITPHLCAELGLVYGNLNQHERGIAILEKGLQLEPEHFGVLLNIGFLHCELGLFDIAEKYYRKAISVRPDYGRGHFNLSLLLLSQGKYEEGWKEYEWRLKMSELNYLYKNLITPAWQGNLAPYQTLFFYCEQGHGDNFQFARFLSKVKKPNNYIILEAHPANVQLFKTLPWVDQIITKGSLLLPFDAHASVLSTPYLTRTLNEMPETPPYLFSTAEKRQYWQQLLPPTTLRRVGICWRGNPTNKLNPRRSLSLAELLPYISLPEIQLVNLKKDVTAEEKELLKKFNVVDLDEKIEDFADVAALIDSVDLTLSIDTSVAHLAGAMNKPVWAMLNCIVEWRYLTNREISPWYPSMRLFHQNERSDWISVFERINAELKNWLRIDKL